MEISQINPDGNVYDIKDATARTEITQIKAQNTYSMTEQDTGKKWIDGKTIYRKILTAGETTTLDTSWKQVSGWSIEVATLGYIVSLITVTSSLLNGVRTRFDTTTLQFSLASGTSNVYVGNYCIIEYTKP